MNHNVTTALCSVAGFWMATVFRHDWKMGLGGIAMGLTLYLVGTVLDRRRGRA